MFDFAQRGPVGTHRYRSCYDAQQGSTTKCAHCGRIIRYCYVLNDQHGKSFVIGTCDFRQYEGTKLGVQLQAAQLLQEHLLKEMQRDQATYGRLGDVVEHRKTWSAARRAGMKLVRTYRASNGEWLPKPLYELHIAVELKPRMYKRVGCALRWYEQQTEKIVALTKEAASI
jgi:hypothetical protein